MHTCVNTPFQRKHVYCELDQVWEIAPQVIMVIIRDIFNIPCI